MEMQQTISRRVNVGDFERKISLATGLGLLFYALTRRSKMSLPLALEAGYMMYRGATGHCVFYQTLEINRAENWYKGIQVLRSVTVNRPKDELFRIWRNFENMPRFMKHLRSVQVSNTDNGRSHWVTTAPLGREIDPSFVVTHTLPLEEAPDAYEIFKYKKDGCIKVVLRP